MRVTVRRPTLVWGLLLCLVLVNGFMAAPSVGHAGHHADHQAGTHSTGICAWLCAAGQGIESAPAPLNTPLQPIEGLVVVQIKPTLTPVSLRNFSRGPPISLL
jgi:hypothetical protein